MFCALSVYCLRHVDRAHCVHAARCVSDVYDVEGVHDVVVVWLVSVV